MLVSQESNLTVGSYNKNYIFICVLFQKQQNSLIAGLRATNDASATATQEHSEEKKEIMVDREEETESKVTGS